MASSPEDLDEGVNKFLNSRAEGPLDQPSPADFRALIEQFDREWVINLGASNKLT
jgi:hypothetical protein